MQVLDIRLTLYDDVDLNEFVWNLAGLIVQDEDYQINYIRPRVKGLGRMVENDNPKFVELTKPE